MPSIDSSCAIEFQSLSKTYKGYNAVDNFTAKIQKGRITGFLGPNGAGKSTTLRVLLGLATPTSGVALIEGHSYKDLAQPLHKIGAVIDSAGFNKSLSASKNLKIIAAAAGVPDSRVEEVLKTVELDNVGKKKVKAFSLGMHQRLSIAAALLTNPEIYILDEPANGLDPIGIAWLRKLLRELTNNGKTVFVSSHQLAEMENTVDDIIIINRGKIVIQGEKNAICQGRSLEETFLAEVEKQ
jgi:ABC-2 type transport system ATP-binding protein